MKKIAQGIVRFRKLILTVAFLLLIPSAIGAVATRINYDILTYLPQDLDSMIGEVALEDDFHLASTGMITVEGLPTNELIAMKKDIEAVPGVMQTFWLSDVIDPSIPTEMLPADVQQFMFGKNDSTMLIVRFDAPSASDETMNAVSQIEKLLRKDCFFGGMSVILQDTKALVNQEMPLYILIAVGASLLVLFLSLESTITPLLFMLGLLFPIAYNFGTNIFLGQISYITEALATVLQLGVTMDFSIFLLHRYQEEKELRSNNEEDTVFENPRMGKRPQKGLSGHRVRLGNLPCMPSKMKKVFGSVTAARKLWECAKSTTSSPWKRTLGSTSAVTVQPSSSTV